MMQANSMMLDPASVEAVVAACAAGGPEAAVLLDELSPSPFVIACTLRQLARSASHASLDALLHHGRSAGFNMAQLLG
eukprot:SAG11_NODE_35312_length_267_cov_0.619048_1_plen_77_part_10